VCGRFTLSIDLGTFIAFFKVDISGFDYQPRFNIAPGQGIPVITGASGQREARQMHWGLIPNWARDRNIGYKMINARAETIDQKPSFRGSFYSRRCLVPADGFYEWQKIENKRQPYRIIVPGSSVFAFAGIWDRWLSPDNEVIYSCSIITTQACSSIKHIHERMPVILEDESEFNTWLKSEHPIYLKKLLRPYSRNMQAYPVSSEVNSPANDYQHLIEHISAE